MFEQPMKAVLTDERFSDPDWNYEGKLDGIRCLALKNERTCACARATTGTRRHVMPPA